MNKKPYRTLAVLLLSAMLLTACGGNPAGEETGGPVGIAVQVRTVERRDIFAENRASGKVAADNEVSLMVASAAKCVEVYAQAGDTVTAGQKLCKLDLGSPRLPTPPPVLGMYMPTVARVRAFLRTPL